MQLDPTVQYIALTFRSLRVAGDILIFLVVHLSCIHFNFLIRFVVPLWHPAVWIAGACSFLNAEIEMMVRAS